jgi:hypothetical protein
MPFLPRLPPEVAGWTVADDLVSNIESAPTFLGCAGARGSRCEARRSSAQTRGGPRTSGSLRSIIDTGCTSGIPRSKHTKACVPSPTNSCSTTARRWERPTRSTSTPRELFGLEGEANELTNVYDRPGYAEVQVHLQAGLKQLRKQCGDTDVPLSRAPPEVHPGEARCRRASDVNRTAITRGKIAGSRRCPSV